MWINSSILYISNTENVQLNFHRSSQIFSNLNSHNLPLSNFLLTPPPLVSNGPKKRSFLLDPSLRNPCRLFLLPTLLMIWDKIEEALSICSLKKYQKTHSSRRKSFGMLLLPSVVMMRHKFDEASTRCSLKKEVLAVCVERIFQHTEHYIAQANLGKFSPPPPKKRYLLRIFPKGGGGGSLFNSKNFW